MKRQNWLPQPRTADADDTALPALQPFTFSWKAAM
jgi:hypothetical protein